MIHKIKKGETPIFTEIRILPENRSFKSLEKAVRMDMEEIEVSRVIIASVSIELNSHVWGGGWYILARYHLHEGDQIHRHVDWDHPNHLVSNKKRWVVSDPSSHD